MLKYSSIACAVVLVLLLSSPLGAQEAGVSQGAAEVQPTLATDQRADKPTFAEKMRRFVENNPTVQRLRSDEGFYPKIGGLSPGSGFAGGGGYRRHLGRTYVDVSGAASTKAYRGVDAKMRWLQTASKSLEISTNVKFRNNTQDDFYGPGIDSSDASRVDFGIRSTDVVTRVAGRVRPWLRLGADVGYFMPSVRQGRDDNLRSIEQVFTDVTAPGLARQPRFLHDGVFAESDTRDAPGFPRRGGFYRAEYALWNDRTLDEYDFRRLEVEGSQFFAVASKDVVAVRLSLTYANNAPGDRVPFYLLPYVGGGDTVRAFREFRFRDENAGLFNIELRHRVHPLVHLAGFVDVGKVAHDWQHINPTNAKAAYGFGVRAGNDERVFLRFDVAYGGDGTRVFLKFSPAF